MTKKVLLITSENFPYGGAAANFLRLFSQGIHDNGINISVEILKGHKFGSYRNISRCGKVNGTDFLYLSYKNRPDNKILKILDDVLGIILGLLRLIIFRIQKGKIVFTYLDRGYRGFSLILLAKILNIKIFGIIVEGYDNSHKPLIIKLDNYLKYKVNNILYSGIIVLSRNLHSLYQKHYDQRKIYIQPNLLDLEAFGNSSHTSANNGAIRFGYSGVPTQIKDGILDLLKAFSQLSKLVDNIELLIIGDSLGKSLIPDLQDFAVNLGIDNKVVFTGLVSHEEIPSLLNTCDILVLTRPDNYITKAGFPTKLGEYLACKKPILLTRFGDIPIYFSDTLNAYLTQPGEPDEISKKMLEIIQNKEDWARIGESGYNWAKQNLDFHTSTARIIQFFNLR